jgi:hypothetical protein
MLLCSERFSPSAFMGREWSVAEEDERANQPTSFEVEAIKLISCLPQGTEVRLGGRAFLACWENQSALPSEWKEPFTFVFFDGLILAHTNGNRYSLYLTWERDTWKWYSCWLGNTRWARSLSAML